MSPTSQIPSTLISSTECFYRNENISPICLNGLAASVNITVLSSKGNATSPLQYGIMFEVRLLYVRNRRATDLLLPGNQSQWRWGPLRRVDSESGFSE